MNDLQQAIDRTHFLIDELRQDLTRFRSMTNIPYTHAPAVIGDTPAEAWLRSCPPLPPRRRRTLRRQVWIILALLVIVAVLAGLAGKHGL